MNLTERVTSLSDAEQAYLARWITAIYPDIVEQALAALARYRSEHPDSARLMLGPETLCRCGHLEHVHNTVGHSSGRGFCTECEPGRCGRYEQAEERHLGS